MDGYCTADADELKRASVDRRAERPGGAFLPSATSILPIAIFNPWMEGWKVGKMEGLKDGRMKG